MALKPSFLCIPRQFLLSGSRKQYIASYYLGLFDSQALPRSNEVCVFQVVPTNNLFRCCAVALRNGAHIVATLHRVIRSFACAAACRKFDFLSRTDEVRILNAIQVLKHSRCRTIPLSNLT